MGSWWLDDVVNVSCITHDACMQCAKLATCPPPSPEGSDDLAGELLQGVEQGSIPARRATKMAGMISRKFKKHGLFILFEYTFSSAPMPNLCSHRYGSYI